MKYLDTAFEKIRVRTKFDIAYLISSLVLLGLIFHIDTCLVDAFYILVFLSVSLFLRVNLCKTKQLSAFNFLHLVITFKLMLNVDKVANYPEGKYDLINFLIYICILFLLIFSVKYLRNKSTMIYSMAAPFLVFFHILDFPQDITRQIIGNTLVTPTEPVYFTKIRFENIYSVRLKRPDRNPVSRSVYNPRKPIYFALKHGEYKEMRGASFVAGDGSMGVQYISENKLAFRLLSGKGE